MQGEAWCDGAGTGSFLVLFASQLHLVVCSSVVHLLCVCFRVYMIKYRCTPHSVNLFISCDKLFVLISNHQTPKSALSSMTAH